MNVQYITSEFLEGKLVQKFKFVENGPSGESFLWIDASTGAPVKYTSSMQGTVVVGKFSDYSIFVDEAEFTIPKRLVCQENPQLMNEVAERHFMKHPARLF